VVGPGDTASARKLNLNAELVSSKDERNNILPDPYVMDADDASPEDTTVSRPQTATRTKNTVPKSADEPEPQVENEPEIPQEPARKRRKRMEVVDVPRRAGLRSRPAKRQEMQRGNRGRGRKGKG
jgi:hypothetical protein